MPFSEGSLSNQSILRLVLCVVPCGLQEVEKHSPHTQITAIQKIIKACGSRYLKKEFQQESEKEQTWLADWPNLQLASSSSTQQGAKRYKQKSSRKKRLVKKDRPSQRVPLAFCPIPLFFRNVAEVVDEVAILELWQHTWGWSQHIRGAEWKKELCPWATTSALIPHLWISCYVGKISFPFG